jgi:hypothetical protein
MGELVEVLGVSKTSCGRVGGGAGGVNNPTGELVEVLAVSKKESCEAVGGGSGGVKRGSSVCGGVGGVSGGVKNESFGGFGGGFGGVKKQTCGGVEGAGEGFECTRTVFWRSWWRFWGVKETPLGELLEIPGV